MTSLPLKARVLLIALVLGAACSSSTKNNGTSTGSGSPTCTNADALTVSFSPMYSANDGVHTFQIPTIVTGVSGSAIGWYGDTSIVKLQPTTATQAQEGLGDEMITTLAATDAGTTITAEVLSADGGQTGVCGQSILTITGNTPGDWDAGRTRYVDGQVIETDGGCASFASLLNGGWGGAACINCHGATASLTFGPLTIATVQHTPEQTGGYSDSDLANIIQHGEMPDANYFTGLDQNGNDTGLTYSQWQQFHKWTMTPEELVGITCFLRSLTPAPQTGAANFGRFGGTGGNGGGTGGRGGTNGGTNGGGTGGGTGGATGGFGGTGGRHRGDGGGFCM